MTVSAADWRLWLIGVDYSTENQEIRQYNVHNTWILGACDEATGAVKCITVAGKLQLCIVYHERIMQSPSCLEMADWEGQDGW